VLEVTPKLLSRAQIDVYAMSREQVGCGKSARRRGGGSTVAVDSSIAGFEDIARDVADVARRREIELSPTSWTNFNAMGIGDTG